MAAPDYIVWHITESEEELRSGLLHPEFFAEKVKNLKPGSNRMLEVLAVRRAMKELFYGEEQQVVYTEDGRPFLLASDPRRVVPFISISHTKEYAAAISSDVPVGIDIERRGNRVQRVVSHFLKHDEVATLQLAATMRPGEDEDETFLLALHLSWSAKESAFKILGKDYYDLQNLTSVELIDWQSSILTLSVDGRPEPLLIHFDFTDEYVLTWVQDNGGRN